MMPSFCTKKSTYKILFLALTVIIFSLNQVNAQTISFGSSGLVGESVVNPTSLEFGPDGRLYVSQQNGTIWAYTIDRDTEIAGNGTYTISDAEEIDIIKIGVPNHDDSGVYVTTQTRLVTGIKTSGTALNPVLYVTSSDSAIGGSTSGNDTNSDTNSSTISRIEWTGSEWEKIDLVRGLPRCEEDHAINGIEMYENAGNTYLFVAIGGNTNKGAPSNSFAGTPEYYFSGSILKLNLTQIESMPVYKDLRTNTEFVYDLPTLNDPTRIDIDNTHADFPYEVGHPLYNSSIDLGDPFGGNNSLNQAFYETGSPLEVFSHGFRNPYDVLVAENGKIYLSDNGPNSSWGGLPKIYRASDDVYLGNQLTVPGGYDPVNHYITNEMNEEGGTLEGDPLQYLGEITDPNETFYGGHPIPIVAFPSRARVLAYENNGMTWEITNTGPGEDDFASLLVGSSGYFNASFDISDFPDKPTYGEYLLNEPIGSTKINIMDIIPTSTNGICEYTASNFGGIMQGNILTASFNGNINRYVLSASGDSVDEYEATFNGFGSIPLDVIAQGDADIFPGTVWSVTYGSKNITIFEPASVNCLDESDPSFNGSADYDMDGYTNQDEIDNETNYCSQGSKPDDNDGDFISDLNDDDDDNDSILDVNDAFAIDPDNGLSTNLPANFPFWNNDPGTGFFGLGFTGLMLDPSGNTDYLYQFNEVNLSFGGAAGKATVDVINGGDAYLANNNQSNAFQLGVNVDSNSNAFTVHGSVESPLFAIGGSPTDPVDFQSVGISVGNGDQDNYLKIVVMNGTSNADSEYGIQVVLEDGGSITHDVKIDVPGILNANSISLYLSIDPALNNAQPYYSIDSGATLNLVGTPITLPSVFLDDSDNKGLAVGLIGTSRGASLFGATWDFIEVYENQSGVLSFNPDPLDFGPTPTINTERTKFVTLKNEGGPTDGVITITNLNFTGTDAALFSSSTSLPMDISPGSNISIPINFISNSVVGHKTAALEITHSGSNSPTSSSVIGELTDAFIPIARINASGVLVAATDGGPDWEDNFANGNTTGDSYAVDAGSRYPSSGALTNIDYLNKDVTIPNYIEETAYEIIMATQRGVSSSMTYTISAPNGQYIVNLYIANLYNGTSEPNERIIDIDIEDGQEIINNFDASATFGHRVAGMIQKNITVSDGSLEIKFISNLNSAMINAIEILGLEYPIIEVDPIADKTNAEGDNPVETVIASGGNPVENFTYEISGQPDGITINSTTGEFIGTISSSAATGGPNNDGIHEVTITVSKPGSLDVTIEFSWTIKETYDLVLNVSLQGRSDYSGTYSILFYEINDLVTPAYSLSETADASGLMSVSSKIAEGEYKVLVKHPQYLQRLKNININASLIETIPELLAGDVNDDNKVNISDFGILAGTYNLESGDIGYDARADFNVSLKVDISDFGLLAGNYNIFGDTEND